MRGNDVLQGTPDIMVMDSLTGNVTIKMMSAHTTGGSFEAAAMAMAPASARTTTSSSSSSPAPAARPLIANAIEYAAQLVRGKVFEVAKKEFEAAEKAGLSRILRRQGRRRALPPRQRKRSSARAPSPAPPASPVSRSWTLRTLPKVLWKAGIYAETGMGCTGPLVMMSEANHEKAVELLKGAGYIG